MKRILGVLVLMAFPSLLHWGNLFGQYHSLSGDVLFGVGQNDGPTLDLFYGFELDYEYRFTQRHSIGLKGVLIDITNNAFAPYYRVSKSDGFYVDYKYSYGLGPGIGAFYRLYFIDGVYFETAVAGFSVRERFTAYRGANTIEGITPINLTTGSNFPGLKADFLFGFNTPQKGFYTNWTFGLSFLKQTPGVRPYLVASTFGSTTYTFRPYERNYLMFSTSLAFGGKW